MDVRRAVGLVEQVRVIVVLRGEFGSSVALATAETLMAEGFSVIEFTTNSAEPFAAMQAVKRALGDHASVGMGTVLDVETAQRSLNAGADFVVSPAFQPEVVETVQAADVLMVPGVLTPTEAIHAWNMGVPLLKLFPVGALDVTYFQAFVGPFEHMKFTVNGAINADNTLTFLRAGATACGIGGWLTGDGTWDQATIRERARQLRRAVNLAQGHLPTI